MKTIFLTIGATAEKIINTYTELNPYAIFLAIVGFVGNFLSGYWLLLVSVFVVCLIDLYTGVKVSKKNHGEGFKSKKAKAKLNDIKAYYLLLLIPIFIDKILIIENIWFTRIITAVIIGVEGWSIIGNYAILYPHLRALPMIKEKFASEIAAKLDMTAEEVKSKLEGEEDQTKENEAPNDDDSAGQADS